MQMIFASAGWDGASDTDVYRDELRLASQAEDLGFDAFWPVEHHFFDYSFCPDNTELLAFLAARTSTIGLGTAAVILPWNDPLRVAERISMLDVLSGGRVRLAWAAASRAASTHRGSASRWMRLGAASTSRR